MRLTTEGADNGAIWHKGCATKRRGSVPRSSDGPNNTEDWVVVRLPAKVIATTAAAFNPVGGGGMLPPQTMTACGEGPQVRGSNTNRRLVGTPTSDVRRCWRVLTVSIPNILLLHLTQ